MRIHLPLRLRNTNCVPEVPPEATDVQRVGQVSEQDHQRRSDSDYSLCAHNWFVPRSGGVEWSRVNGVGCGVMGVGLFIPRGLGGLG